MSRKWYGRLTVLVVGITSVLCGGWSATAQPAADAAEDRFQQAQRNLSTAIGNLEAYLQANPQGKYVTLARSQLAALQDLKPRSIPPVPTDLTRVDYTYVQWYVDSVERTPTSTKVTLKIINMSPTKDCFFYSFASAPLALTGDDRQIYMMTKVTGELPKAVRSERSGDGLERWIFQGGRTISVEVEFERLPIGVLGGQIQYFSLTNMNTQPIRFSLTNEAQQGKK